MYLATPGFSCSTWGSFSSGILGLLFVQLEHVGSWGLPGGSAVQETQETRAQSQGGQDSLEDEMGTPSSILVWEPGGLQSIGLQWVWHEWVTKHACTHVGSSSLTGVEPGPPALGVLEF